MKLNKINESMRPPSIFFCTVLFFLPVDDNKKTPVTGVQLNFVVPGCLFQPGNKVMHLV